MIGKRDFLFFRSVIFGIAAKLAGACVLFIGLPIIGRSLILSDYSSFLQIMSLASALTLVYGATSTLNIRLLSKANSGESKIEKYKEACISLGASVFAFICAVVISCLLLIITLFNGSENFDVYLLVLVIVTFQGFFQWGDSYLVAARFDYISSIIQMIGSLLIVLLLYFGLNDKLLYVVLIYFGFPLIVHATLFFAVFYKQKPIVFPEINAKSMLSSATGVAPLIVNMIADYFKVFGPGIVLAALGDLHEQAKIATLVLLAARLVNPLSLITRPLIPAFIDAIRNNDLKWLSRAKLVVLILPIFIILIGALASLIFPVDILDWALPTQTKINTRQEFVLTVIFFLTYAYSVLSASVFMVGNQSTLLYAKANALTTVSSLAVGLVCTVFSGKDWVFFSITFGSVCMAIFIFWAALSDVWIKN